MKQIYTNTSTPTPILPRPLELELFCIQIWNFYRNSGRNFVWRNVEDPYKVVVSEIMLQQTQTARVAQKYPQFIEIFPSFQSLAAASFLDVLSAWQGLGYNRRAKFLHQLAVRVVTVHNGKLPHLPEELVKLPGIGPNTAGSVAAFAYNVPTVFIETNIRSVFIHHFFKADEYIHDRHILPLVAATVDRLDARNWYYALMDYGVMLKQLHGNPSRKSAHHVVQSKFEGSDRQIRAQIIRELIAHPGLDFQSLQHVTQATEERLSRIIASMEKDAMIFSHDQRWSIAE